MKVEVIGLNSRPELNGKIGEAKEFDVSNCRYNVEIFGSGEIIACKRDNLREVKHTAANTKVRCPVNP